MTRKISADEALAIAAKLNERSVAERLIINRGVDPNRPDDNGKSPIDRALDNGHESLAKRMKELGSRLKSNPRTRNR